MYLYLHNIDTTFTAVIEMKQRKSKIFIKYSRIDRKRLTAASTKCINKNSCDCLSLPLQQVAGEITAHCSYTCVFYLVNLRPPSAHTITAKYMNNPRGTYSTTPTTGFLHSLGQRTGQDGAHPPNTSLKTNARRHFLHNKNIISFPLLQLKRRLYRKLKLKLKPKIERFSSVFFSLRKKCMKMVKASVSVCGAYTAVAYLKASIWNNENEFLLLDVNEMIFFKFLWLITEFVWKRQYLFQVHLAQKV